MFIATVLRSLKAHFTRRMDDGGGALLTLFYTEVRKMESLRLIYFITPRSNVSCHHLMRAVSDEKKESQGQKPNILTSLFSRLLIDG